MARRPERWEAPADDSAARGSVPLLREDRAFCAAIPAGDRAHAERLVVVPVFIAPPGRLALPPGMADPALGLLVLDGVVTSNLALGDRVASQLIGPGDILNAAATADTVLPARVTHVVNDHARLAILDRHFLAAVQRWPRLLLTLHARLAAQERRLAIHAAIGKLRRIEDRVLALLWWLGERWGRVTPDGIVVPLALTHEAIGRLAGAERPTVSLALTALTRDGAVRRREDGRFVLAHDSLASLRDEPPSRMPASLRPPSTRPRSGTGRALASNRLALGA